MRFKIGNQLSLYNLAIIFYIFFLMQACTRNYTQLDATSNFEKNKAFIYDLIDYLNTIKPTNPKKAVMFGKGMNNNHYDLGIFYEDGSVLENDPNIGGKDLKLNSDKMDSLLNILGWTTKTIDSLSEKLKKTKCLSISSGDPIRMTFGPGKYGIFSYMIFRKPLSDSTINMYNEKYGDNVIDKRAVIIYTTSN